MWFMTGPSDCHGLRVVVTNTAITGAAGEIPGPNAVTYQCAFELNSPSIDYPVTWGGQPTITLQPGGTAISDPVGWDVAAYTQGWVRIGITVATVGQQWYVGMGTNGPGEVSFCSTATTSQIPGTGALSNPSGGSGGDGGQGTFAILGYATSPQPCVQVWGDSIAQGSHDDPDAYGNFGWIDKGLQNGTTPVPHVLHAIPGDTVGEAVTLATSQARRLMARYANNYIIALGTNDISGGATAAEVEANLTALAASLRNYGPCRIIGQTITTVTASTDDWATQGNQTVAAGFQVGGICDQVNEWILSQKGGVYDAVIDNRSLSQNASNLWLTNGTAYYATADGTHPSPASYTLYTPNMIAVLPELLAT